MFVTLCVLLGSASTAQVSSPIAATPSSTSLMLTEQPQGLQRLAALRSSGELETRGELAQAVQVLEPFAQGDDPLAVAIVFHAARLRLELGEPAHPSLENLLADKSFRWGISRQQEARALTILAAALGEVDGGRIRNLVAIEYPRWAEPKAQLNRDQLLQRARNLIRDMDYQKALEELEELLVGAEPAERSQLQREIGHLIGDKIRDGYGRVEAIYRELTAGDDAKIDDLFYLAYAVGKRDDAAAVAVYQEIIERFPRHPELNKARFFVAWTSFHLEKLDEAVRLFDEFLHKQPTSGYRFAVRWYRGITHYRLGHFAEALLDFDFIARQTKDRSKGKYWSARCLRALGEPERADKIFRDLAGKGPFAYYGIMSRALLDDEDRPPLFVDAKVGPVQGLTHADALAAMKRLPFHAKQLLEEAFAAIDAGEPGLAESVLAHVESTSLAAAHHAPLRRWLQWNLGVVSSYLNSPESRRCRRSLAVDPTSADAGACWQRVYPMPYAQQIEAVRGEVPAAVFWSVMRQESFYKPTARSHADALGLMQVIPQVGEPVVTARGGVFEPYALYQPQTNLTIFARAAQERFERYDGHLPLVLMSYNATPHRTDLWLRDNHDLPFDLFVEEIPYGETRDYVKHISSNLLRYQTLLGVRSGELHERAGLPHPDARVGEAYAGLMERLSETEIATR